MDLAETKKLRILLLVYDRRPNSHPSIDANASTRGFMQWGGDKQGRDQDQKQEQEQEQG